MTTNEKESQRGQTLITVMLQVIAPPLNQLDYLSSDETSDEGGGCDIDFDFLLGENHFEDDDDEDCLSSDLSRKTSVGEEDISSIEGEITPHTNTSREILYKMVPQQGSNGDDARQPCE